MALLNGASGAPIVMGGAPGFSGQSAYDIWLAAGNVGTIVEYLASQRGTDGRDGIDGQAGAGTIVTRTAAVYIPASTYVVNLPGDACTIADPKNLTHLGQVLGVVVQGIAQGGRIAIQGIGSISGVSGSFNPGDPLFIGDGTTGRLGSIVNVPPAVRSDADVWRQQVGTATTASLINGLLGPVYKVPALGSTAIVRASGGYAMISDLGRGFVEATPTSVVASLLTILDGLPWLPDSPANYPDAGGLFRNGDANGWTLTRIYPKA